MILKYVVNVNLLNNFFLYMLSDRSIIEIELRRFYNGSVTGTEDESGERATFEPAVYFTETWMMRNRETVESKRNNRCLEEIKSKIHGTRGACVFIKADMPGA